MTRWLRAHWPMALSAAIGASLGAAYAHFVGCRTGTCPLTSNVPTAAIYGAVVGALAGWSGKRGK